MTKERLIGIAAQNGFDKVYVLAPTRTERYQVNAYNEAIYDDPAEILPDVKSMIVLIKAYAPFDKAAEGGNGATISAYYPASHSAYLSARAIADALREEGYPAVSNAQIAVKPLLIKHRIGKKGANTLVAIPEFGSRFHVQVILTTLELEADRIGIAEGDLDSNCINCGACLAACPTGAIIKGAFLPDLCLRSMDEGKLVPGPMRALFENRLFGCDICQDVCPRNNGRIVLPMPEGLERDLSLPQLLSGNLGELSLYIGRNYARKRRIRMKAALVAGNLKRRDCLDLLKDMAKDGTDEEKIHARWAIDRIEEDEV